MNPITLPTDNLYKFMAIAGILMIGSVAFFTENQVANIEKSIIAHETQAETHKIRTDFLEKKINIYAYEKLKSHQKAIESFNQISEVRNKTEAYLDESHLLREELAKLSGNLKITKYMNERLIRLQPFLLFYFFFGHILATIGFILWYLRIQKFEDKKIKQEISKDLNSPAISMSNSPRNKRDARKH